MLSAFSTALDFSDSGVLRHHIRVALIAREIAEEINLSPFQTNNLVYAAIVHDIGAVTWQDKATLRNFEIVDSRKHCLRGYELLKQSPLFKHLAQIILYHHSRWDGTEGELRGEEIPLASRIIHLADRVDVLIKENVYILHQRQDIMNSIKSLAGKVFDPTLVDALASLSERESFWLDLSPRQLESCLLEKFTGHVKKIDLPELLSIGELFAQVVDAKSSFTYNHSRMVSAVAAHMGYIAGYNDQKCQILRVAGLLHDLGKMAVPEYILEKPGKLNDAEYNIIKCHTYYTYRILEMVEGFEEINQWASFHHENLKGTGYPFKKQAHELSPEARMIAVCDIFTALVEDRPYRSGMNRAKVEQILCQKVEQGELDPQWVHLLLEHYNDLVVYKDI